ncbi:hypothetical protein [Sulfurimonas sp. C5]|uniref:hypothetical protein n=1 Tax=Sulfurimonas sp. C5 TaxID=3036947 RepID=UPI0024581081|nr:hypothetical protein [Sulfurimonas sp. C5]MDH4944557.1 hypothetical protein [Sulfurimonas sp. C5]
MKAKLSQTLGMIFLASSLYAGNTYSAAFVNMDMDYREYDDNGQILDSEQSNSVTGFELGFGMDLECDDDGCPNLDFKALVLKGNTDYTGAYIGSGLPYGSVKSTTSNLIYDLSLDYTQTDKVNGFGVTYGLGLGYHSWYRELSSLQNERYYWFYITPVLGFSTEITKNLKIATQFKYKYALRPKMKANLISEEFKLGKTDTIEVTIPVTYSYSEQTEFFVAYTYSKQTIKKSDLVPQGGYLYYEPKSKTNDNYFKVGISFKY